MAYVITEPCLGVCDVSCVKVCPVDCIHGPKSVREIEDIRESNRKTVLAKVQMYIDPDACIDCGACEPECPVDAIFEADSVPAKWRAYTEKNAAYFRR
ncbi:MAG: 4Fe-4S binding protein [Myxococcales bacterium]|nr:4Fe-4S binding protein [Myxococcales bacterium]